MSYASVMLHKSSTISMYILITRPAHTHTVAVYLLFSILSVQTCVFVFPPPIIDGFSSQTVMI